MRWPDGFMWGTGASSTQTEGASPASDWWDWERTGPAPPSSDGNGFAVRYRDVLTAALEAGVEPLDNTPPTRRLAGLLDDLNWQAGLGLFRDGILRGPGLDPVERPDLIGFSFYSTMGVSQGVRVPCPPDAPVSPLGYGIWATAWAGYWTAVDNYEWLNGFDIPFGLIDRDRHVRPSAQVLKREAAG